MTSLICTGGSMAISLIARLFIVGYSHELIISFLIVSSLLITAMATDEKFRLAKNVLVFVCGLGSMFFLPSAVFTPAIILTGLYINKLSVVFPVIRFCFLRVCGAAARRLRSDRSGRRPKATQSARFPDRCSAARRIH